MNPEKGKDGKYFRNILIVLLVFIFLVLWLFFYSNLIVLPGFLYRSNQLPEFRFNQSETVEQAIGKNYTIRIRLSSYFCKNLSGSCLGIGAVSPPNEFISKEYNNDPTYWNLAVKRIEINDDVITVRSSTDFFYFELLNDRTIWLIPTKQMFIWDLNDKIKGELESLEIINNSIEIKFGGAGTYRTLVAVTDEVDTVLKNVNGSNLTTFYNFTIQ